MIDYLDLAKRLKGKSLGASLPFEEANALMPTVYQAPNGRWKHDDHFLMKRTRRMDTSFRKLFPAFKVDGNRDPVWTPLQPGYPLAPNTEIRMMPVNGILIPHYLTMHPAHDPGGWSVQGYWDENENRVIPCYVTWSSKVMTWGPWKGKYWYHNRGLKPDVNAKAIECLENPGMVGDCMWNYFPPVGEWSGPMLKEYKN